MSENCLFLNVWSAPAAAKRPVLVWIHGGGFGYGYGIQADYDGDQFARKGLVYVDLNYRVGASGFLAHLALSAESPHQSSDYYGILDQIAALQWVQRNIAAFGGDPDDVTIFREPAGAISVNILSASPLAKGLFKRGIGVAAHADEVPYAFDALQTGCSWDAMDQIARSMSSYYANFANNGDSNGPDLPNWPQFDSAGLQRMVFGDSGIAATGQTQADRQKPIRRALVPGRQVNRG